MASDKPAPDDKARYDKPREPRQPGVVEQGPRDAEHLDGSRKTPEDPKRRR